MFSDSKQCRRSRKNTRVNKGSKVCKNNLVPAKGDTAHQFTAPGPLDIRGPCPGLNTAANHNFLSHDGITTFIELVDMQQNLYGVGYDLAVLLATLGVGLDGDVATGRLSIGCDATSRTSSTGGEELGLDGHNKFEGDTSLSRNDYFLANGDDFHMNATLFQMMSESTGGLFNEPNLAKYRYQRYQQSLAENGQFYFGPKSLLLYGAASFLYELFPSLGNAGTPDQATQNSFFGATPNGDGTYTFNNKEQIPANWYSRATPYTIPLVALEIFKQYNQYPVAFGGNTGAPNTFIGLQPTPPFLTSSGKIGSAQGVECLLYQIATEDMPSALNGGTFLNSTLSALQLAFMRSKIGPIQALSPCPINYNYS